MECRLPTPGVGRRLLFKDIALPLRIGIIGAGAFASRRHLPDFLKDPRVEVVAACRRDPEQLEHFCDHFGIPKRYTDWQGMLDSERLDGVLIATPHEQHAEQAREAMLRGLHVLAEKPMALDADEADALAAMAAKFGVQLGVAFNPPYWRHTEEMRRGIADGRIGELENVEIFWSGSAASVFGRAPMPENMAGVVKPTLFRADAGKSGGGFLMDAGGHLMSELLWVTGKSALRVTALVDELPSDMRAILAVELEGNVHVSVQLNGISACSSRRIRNTYYGVNGSAESTAAPFAVTWTDASSAIKVAEAEMPDVPTPVSDWINAIETGSILRGSPQHGAAVTRLLCAAYRSAASGVSERI